jgi:hypothetical protein
MSPVTLDLSGQTFGRLSVVRPAGGRGIKTTWLCRCECGRSVVKTTDSLRRGITRSCGCLRREVTRRMTTKHGAARRVGGKKVSEYLVWRNMKRRCHDPKNKHYENYGGRGITVCPEWINDYAAFAAHVGKRPSPTHSIERIDNNGHYEPGNVRWATQSEQCRNQRKSILLTHGGETKPLKEWAEKLRIPYYTLFARIRKLGWSVERALIEPVHSKFWGGETGR